MPHGLLREFRGKCQPDSINGSQPEKTYLTRVDPLSGNVSRISPQRAARPIGISANLDIQPVERCEFCQYSEFTPEPRVMHPSGAVSVANKYPWEKYDWITIYPPFGQHKLLVSDLYFEDLERMVESSYDLALLCSRDPEIIAFMDFTNWGAFAGASQQHPHSQRKSITFVADPVQEGEWEHCRRIVERDGRNAFDLLLEEERQDGRRLIYDNDVVIMAAFAPTCPDEVLVFPKEPFSHILQTHREERVRIFRPALGIFPALFFYRGITDFNIAVHMAPFSEMELARHYFRWHLHIYPRRSRLPVDRAGAELGFGTNVIDSLPETTAACLRQWYQRGPQETMIACCPDGTPHQRLLAEFRRVTGGK